MPFIGGEMGSDKARLHACTHSQPPRLLARKNARSEVGMRREMARIANPPQPAGPGDLGTAEAHAPPFFGALGARSSVEVASGVTFRLQCAAYSV
mmetsp:Transcript_4764/g.12690  ORF Transcript_4764/g.12690 Transcript_4764/m.12690 type:complete len:95 (-) Transcript_4764:120-404(-)